MRFKIRFVIINHIFKLFLISLFLLAVMGGLLVWCFKIDVTAKGHGIVKCKHWVDIKPEINGIIRQIRVHEGQWVQKGTTLFTLEDRERKLEVESAKLKIEELEINVAKVKNQLLLSEQNITEAINEAHAAMTTAKVNYRIAAKGPKPEAVRLAKSKILRAKKQVEKTRKDYERILTAFELKLVSKQETEETFHRLQIAEVELRLSRDDLNLLRNKFDADQVAATESEVKRCEAILNRTLTRRSELEIMRQDLESANKMLAKEKKRLALLKKHLMLTRIDTPIDGYVLTHDTEHLTGKAVEQGMVVLRIGDTRKYIIDCSVSENDFPLISTGQIARIQIKPFPKGEYRLFEGKVTQVSAQMSGKEVALKTGAGERLPMITGNATSSVQGYYPVILELRPPYSISLFDKQYEIKPGFSAEVEIITHRERIATFLLRRVLRIKGKLSSQHIHF